MYYYRYGETVFASLLPDLPLEAADRPSAGTPSLFLIDRDPIAGRSSFCVSDPRQLTAKAEDVSWLDPSRMGVAAPALPKRIQRTIDARLLRAVNIRHPRWADFAAAPDIQPPGRRRINLLAVGDVGGTLLTALKLLGGDCIESIGICDLNQKAVARWMAEMGQVSWPWDYDALPEVEPAAAGDLFRCDVFLFAATRGVPPVGGGVRDVRMAQFSANRPLVEQYARQARQAGFRGLFIVLSDPVDPLCKAAYLASNQGPDGQWDGLGLRAEQIQGFGLGVMNARAAYFAKQDPRFRSFLTDGRSYGPHGQGLVIANSLTHYDDGLSRELTDLVTTANLRIRELGFKPYVAPAISSGAMQLLLTLRRSWHCSSVALGDVWFGVRNRLTAAGLEIETASLPTPLFDRLRETQALLREII